MLFKRDKCSNMTELEINIRWIISIIFAILAFATPYWFLIFVTIALVYQNIIKNCFFYSFFKLNRKTVELNSYFEALPKYNPEPVLIVNNEAKILFKNNPAKKIFKDDNFFMFLKDELDIKKIIEENLEEQISENLNEELVYLFTLKGVKTLNAMMVYGTDITEVELANREILNIQKDIIYTMGAIGESRSKETGNHVKRVAKYSRLLALKYGLNEEDAELLMMASPMHDIGKVGISDSILNKPGKLTDDEFKIMKTHSTLGYNMLKSSDKPIIKAAAIVAREHHEKWDGSGYPKKLKGEEIHIFGRITAVADVFDALASDRVYKKAWPIDEVLKFFEEQKGKHFDPKLVDILFENFNEFDEIRLAYKD